MYCNVNIVFHAAFIEEGIGTLPTIVDLKLWNVLKKYQTESMIYKILNNSFKFLQLKLLTLFSTINTVANF